MHEGALEVLFDAEFIGGGDLQGRCQGRCGIMLPPADLLNLAKPHFSNITGLYSRQPSCPCVHRHLLADSCLHMQGQLDLNRSR